MAEAAAESQLTASNNDISDKTYRGELLLISHFLTSFRHYYSWNCEELDDGELGFAIKPRDLERALTLKYLLRGKANLLDQMSFAGGEEGDRVAITRNSDFLADLESELGERAKNKQRHQRDLHICELLERFEVWSTKDVAHTLLLSPTCGCLSQEEASSWCWSKLLHLPAASYFANKIATRAADEPGLVQEATQQRQEKRQLDDTSGEKGATLFSKIYHKAHIEPSSHALCSLIIPPSHYQWEEFARISLPLSSLGVSAAANNSPFCSTRRHMSASHSPTSTRKNNIYAPEFDFQAHDLVALWVRAQRSSAAMRHLIQIFSRPNETELSQLAEVSQVEDCSSMPDGKHHVVFRGNHKSTKRRVLAETQQVQVLVVWAVMNNILFHQQYMKGQLEADGKTRKSPSSKRPRMASGLSSQSKVSKKSRLETGPVKLESTSLVDFETKLLQNCHSHLLRLFGRKHEALIAIIYFTKQTSFPSAGARMYYEGKGFYEQCKNVKIPAALQKRLEKFVADGDKLSLARIDRRLRRGIYDSRVCKQSRDSPFYSTVNRLLRAFKEVVEESSITVDPNLLQSVVNDFDRLYQNFHEILSREGTLAAAKSLVDIDNDGVDMDLATTEDLDEDSATRLSKLLVGTSSPWMEACGVCAKKHQNREFICCAICETMYHKDCYSPSNFCFAQMKDLMPGMTKDSQLLSVELPEKSDLTPDFHQEEWTRHSLTLRREPLADGRGVVSVGVELRQTSAARDSWRFLNSSPSITLEELFTEQIEEQYPLGLSDEVEGCIVTKVQPNGAGHNGGILRNDVIVGLQYVSFLEGSPKSCTETLHWFANLGKESRLDLFRAKATEVKLTVLRPNKDLISQSFRWIERLRAHNKFTWDLLTKETTISFCQSCQKQGSGTENENEADRVIREAKNCRAVVRRLAGCASLYHYEHNSGSHKDCVSLARLDAMMNYIILATRSSQQWDSRELDQLRNLENAFFYPPWVSQKRERLGWAPKECEQWPVDLLLRGMGLLFRQRRASPVIQGMPTIKEEKRAMVKHFLHLFCSWCVQMSEISAKMLPRSALYASRPFSETCCACQVQPATRDRNGASVCNSKLCLRVVNKNQWDNDSLTTYGENSKLIGATLLVFPGDPWLAHVSQRESLYINSYGRPVEFIVTMYIPQLGGSEGQFFLLPVISEVQLQFLLDRCSLLQKPPRILTPDTLEHWIKGTVLGLNGVLRVSKTDLNKKLFETTQFFERVGAQITAWGKSRSKPTVGVSTQVLEKQASTTSLFSTTGRSPLGLLSSENIKSFLRRKVGREALLIDCLIRLPTPMLKQMLSTWNTWRDPTPSSGHHPQTEHMIDQSSVSGRQEQQPRNSQGALEDDVLQPTRDNFCMPPQQQRGHFTVLYTDLYFTSQEEKTNMTIALQQQQLGLPEALDNTDQRCKRTIVLTRPQASVGQSSLPEYSGVGWGFECIRWHHEGLFRVGRVHPASPASLAGLQSHDVILSMNGREVSHNPWTTPLICCSILASPLCVGRASHKLDVMASALRVIGGNGPVRGPLVLELHRPSLVGKRQNAHSRSPALHGTTADEMKARMPPAKVRARQTDHVDQNSQPPAGNPGETDTGSLLQRNSNNNQLLASGALPGDDTMGAREDWNAVHTGGFPTPSDNNQAQTNEVQTGGRNVVIQGSQSGTTMLLTPSDNANIAAIAAVKRLHPRLIHLISVTLPQRKPIKARHLYVALGLNTVLTTCEAAVYLEAVYRNFPMMALRLLCPRYSLEVLARQIEQLVVHGTNGLNQIPRLPKQIFSKLLVKDYDRFKEEPKEPKIFHDQSGAFALPLGKLALDRSVEEILRDEIASSLHRPQEEPDASVDGLAQQQQQDNLEPLQLEPRSHAPGQNASQQHSAFYNQPTMARPQAHNGGHAPFYSQPHMAAPPYNNYYPPRPGNYQMPHPPQAYDRRGQPQDPHAPYADNPAERIRGGGPSPEEEKVKGPPLFGSSLSSWHDQVVSFEAETDREGKKADAVFIGRVQLPENLRNGKDELIIEIDEVNVACFFASNIGCFDKVQIAPVEVEQLHCVTEGSKYFDLLGNIERSFGSLWRRQESAKGPAEDGGAQVDPASQLQQSSQSLSAAGPESAPGGEQVGRHGVDETSSALPEISRDSAVEKAAFNFAQQFRYFDGANKPLGTLPDGRIVMWFPNDPLGIYIQDVSGECEVSQTQAVFVESVSRTNKERQGFEKLCTGVDPFACRFGCTWVAKDPNSPLRLAEFQNQGMLRRHHEKFHSYSADPNECFRLDEQACFTRVGDTLSFQNLTSDLTSAACAVSAKVAELARTTVPAPAHSDPSGQRIVCSPSRYRCSLALKDILALAKAGHSGNNKPLHQIVTLLLKIRLLFNLTPAISLSSGALKGLQVGQPRQDGRLGPYRNLCSCSPDSPWAAKAGTLSCSLCALTTEANILRGGNEVRRPQGIGCAIPSILVHGSDLNALATPVYGEMGFAKLLLLRIANHLPTQMRANGPGDPKDPLGKLRFNFWGGQGARRFESFVRGSSSIHALAQGLAVLMASVAHDKMPEWWRLGEFGWSQGIQQLLMCPSVPSLILRLLVFDLALTEYCAVGCKEKPYKTLNVTEISGSEGHLSTEQRMQMVCESAAANSIARCQKHDYLCSVCGDGGSLVCCEFCSCTVHSNCCSPRIPLEIESWVCAACTVDVQELAK